MKKYLSIVVVGCLGLCAGFTLCYLSLVPKTEVKATEATVITIARDGNMYLANERLDLGRLAASLKEQAAQGRTITIRADKNTDYKRIVEVVDACKAAGVGRIAMSTTD